MYNLFTYYIYIYIYILKLSGLIDYLNSEKNQLDFIFRLKKVPKYFMLVFVGINLVL